MRGLLAILLAALLALVLTLVGPWSPRTKAAELQNTIQSQFATNGITGITADMEGNVVKLRGAASDAVVKQQAFDIAQAARCETCEDKKWHEVVDETTVAAPTLPTANPYTFSAVLDENGQVVLNGVVPNEATRARVIAEAETHFPGRVTDRTVTVAMGQPNESWGDAISLNLNELHLLERGRLSMNGTDVVLSGRAATVAIRDEINELSANEPAGYNQVLNIEVIGEEAENVGTLDNASLCQELLNDLNQENAIQFAVNSTKLEPGRPQDILKALAGGMKQCEAFRVKVEGHTSTPGDNAYNLQLSKGRAQTVMAFLANAQEIDEARLSSEGYGETRLKVSPETTDADRAANRRIEFIVSR